MATLRRVGSGVTMLAATPAEPLLRTGAPATLAGLAMGVPFGVALEKSGVVEPHVITDQFKFKDMTMMKMMLAGGAFASPLVYGLHAAGAIHVPFLDFVPGAQIVGGLLIGSGIALSKACPTTVFAQLGVGNKNAAYTLGGGLLGAALYGYTQPFLTTALPFLFKSYGSVTLPSLLGVPGWMVAVPYAALVGAGLYYLEKFWPSKTEEECCGLRCIMTARRWCPYFAGGILAALQPLSYLMVGDQLGASGAFVTVMGHILSLVDKSVKTAKSFFSSFLHGPVNMWKLAMMQSVVAGAYLSKKASEPKEKEEEKEITPAEQCPYGSFLGGLAMIFGSCMAGGCTSGQGLSGIARLEVGAFLNVAAIFAGGILLTKALPMLVSHCCMGKKTEMKEEKKKVEEKTEEEKKKE